MQIKSRIDANFLMQVKVELMLIFNTNEEVRLTQKNCETT